MSFCDVDEGGGRGGHYFALPGQSSSIEDTRAGQYCGNLPFVPYWKNGCQRLKIMRRTVVLMLLTSHRDKTIMLHSNSVNS